MTPLSPGVFQPGNRLGEYEIVEVVSRGYFSFNLVVRDDDGDLYHAVVHWRAEEEPAITHKGLAFELRLSHRGLAGIKNIGVPCAATGEHMWFVRELLPPPLADVVAKTGQALSPREVLEVGRGVCDLLEYLHDPAQRPDGPRRGAAIVHGFLVPGYIQRAKDGTIKVGGMDVQELIAAGVPVPLRHQAYRAPEFLGLLPGELKPANDLWALAGCMLYLAGGGPPTSTREEIAEDERRRDSTAGAEPVGAEYEATLVERLKAEHAGDLPRKRAGAAVTNPLLQGILCKALDQKPAQRFPTAAEMGLAIREALREFLTFKPGDPLGPYRVEAVRRYGIHSDTLDLRGPDDQPYQGVVHVRQHADPERRIILEHLRFFQSLKHAHMAEIVHVGEPCEESHGRIWYVRERLGTSPEDDALAGRRQPPDAVLRIGLALCEVLEYLHGHRHPVSGKPAVHGFLLPSYVYLGADGVKLTGTDILGLALAGDQMPEFHLPYRSPECSRVGAAGLTPDNDLWAVAAVMYRFAAAEVVTGGAALAEVRHAHRHGVPRQRAGLLPAQPLRELLERAFASELRDRFGSAAEMRLAIGRALASLESVLPPPPPPPDPIPSPEPAGEAFSSQTVVLRYPAPIAIAYRRFCSRREPADRLAQVFATFDLTIKYLVYLALADLARVRVRRGPPYEPLPTHAGFNFTRHPIRMTLGGMLATLRAAADELAGQKDRFFAELPELCRTGGLPDQEVANWILANRLVWAHTEDGQSLTTEECRQLLPEARPRLERLLHAIDFVRRYPLGFVTAGDPVGGGRFRYRVHSCMGARVAHGEEVYPMETEVRFPIGIPFVVAPDQSAALCIWPFLLFREADATQRSGLYLFKGIDTKAKYLTEIEAVAMDHKNTWPVSLRPCGAESHDWLWEELGNLPQTVPITPRLGLFRGLAESRVGRLTGRILANEQRQYRLIGPIARGGFGTVYDAVDVESGLRVAVKVLEDRVGLSPEDNRTYFERFRGDYETLRRAGSAFPGIVRVFEWGNSIIDFWDYPWFSMQFAAGGDLAGRLRERQEALGDELPWGDTDARQQVIEEFRAVAEAVAHLHKQQLIHRDIKPANVLVVDDGESGVEFRLTDFGLVRDLNRPPGRASIGPAVTSTGAVVGTRDYMAPEQERGDPVTPAADVYSLGILLAELATGRRPTQATADITQSPVERDGWVRRLPKGLRELIVRCTHRDPAGRPSDAGEVLREFEPVTVYPSVGAGTA